MRITFYLDDSVAEAYAKMAKKLGVEQKQAIKDQLARFQTVCPCERNLVLDGAQVKELESIVETTLETPERLAREVRTMSSLKIGPVERPITEWETARLHEEASFHGQTAKEYLLARVDEVFDYVFQRT